MRALHYVLALFASLGIAASSASASADLPERVLFVGNSLTYVGNLPAVFSSLAAANGREIQSDMIVRGGATLAQRLADGSVARALTSRAYSFVVLQERGGELTCSFGHDACIRSRQAIVQLAHLAEAKGARVLLLGTYQVLPAASRRLVEAESGAAAEAGISYVEISARFQRLKNRDFGMPWFAPDGMHPGPALTLLDAMLLYEAMFGALPTPDKLEVHAPIYGTTSGLTESLRAPDAPPPRSDTPMRMQYDQRSVETLSAALAATGR